MNYQLIRPVSEDAVQAVMSARTLWQFSQSEYSPVFSDGLTESEDSPAESVSVTISSFPYAAPTFNVMSTVSNNELLDSMTAVLENFDSILARMEFDELAREWKKSKDRWSSKAMSMAQDPNYLRVIGMGQSAIPHILRQLQDELAANQPDHWFVALWSITGENPIQPQHQGVLREMARDWIKWGIDRGLVDGDGMGA
jgi:hypothetical protein